MMILVVGATGYLGGLICRELVNAGRPVRAMARTTSNVTYLKTLGIDIVNADLNDPTTLPAALEGCDTVIYTASCAAPVRRGDAVAGDLRRTKRMIDAAKGAGVSRFLFISTLQPIRTRPLLMHEKFQAEEYLKNSGLDYTIIRAGAFMEVWMALLGSAIPVAPVEPGLTHTLERPGFTRRYFDSIRQSIDKQSVARINGSGQTKVAWVATADVAHTTVMALDEPLCHRNTLELPGVTLTWLQTVEIFERVLHRAITVKHTPVFMLRLMGAFIGLFVSRAGGVLIAASVAGAIEDMLPDGYQFRRIFPKYEFQTPEQFLKERLAVTRQTLPHAG